MIYTYVLPTTSDRFGFIHQQQRGLLSGSEEGKFHCAGRSITGGWPSCGAAVERDSWTREGWKAGPHWWIFYIRKDRTVIYFVFQDFTCRFYPFDLFGGWYTWWRGSNSPAFMGWKQSDFFEDVISKKKLPESRASWWEPPVTHCWKGEKTIYNCVSYIHHTYKIYNHICIQSNAYICIYYVYKCICIYMYIYICVCVCLFRSRSHPNKLL